MRVFSDNVKTLLRSDEVSVAYCVQIEGLSQPFRDTSNATPVVINELTYTPESGLASVEAPRLSDIVDKASYKVVYTDPTSTLLSELENSISGREMVVYAVLRNTTNAALGGIPPGMLLTSLNDVILVYKGRIDSTGYTLDPDNGTITVVIEGGSPMANLGMPKARYTSKESMSFIDPADTCFDEIFIGAEDAALLWGK